MPGGPGGSAGGAGARSTCVCPGQRDGRQEGRGDTGVSGTELDALEWWGPAVQQGPGCGGCRIRGQSTWASGG